MRHVYVNVRLSFTSTFLCITKKEVIQIDIFYLNYNSLSRFFKNFFLLLLFPLISSHPIIIKRERERKERLHTFSFSLSLGFNNSILAFSFSPFFLLRFLCTHIQAYIHILYRRAVTKVEPIYRTYIYNIVDIHIVL
jgi:hypothetical protein